jgi:LuxR family maltose regulon positive regulatory protein
MLRAILPTVNEELLVDYVRALLVAFVQEQSDRVKLSRSEPAASTSAESALLVAPLSPQERRVLHLLAAGLSNPEIANELVVSVNTIKSQVRSIYRKLNVNSRQEARDAADLPLVSGKCGSSGEFASSVAVDALG